MKTRTLIAGLVLAAGLLLGSSRTSEAGWYRYGGPRHFGYYSYAPAYAPNAYRPFYRPYYAPYVYRPYYASYYYAPRPYFHRPYYRPRFGFGFRFGW